MPLTFIVTNCFAGIRPRLHVVNPTHRHTHQPLTGTRHELGRLGPLLSTLTRGLDLAEFKLLLGQQVIDGFGVARLDEILLRQIQDLDLRVANVAQHDGRVGVQVLALGLGHDLFVQRTRLVVVGQFAFMVEVRLAADDGVGDAIWCLGHIASEPADWFV